MKILQKNETIKLCTGLTEYEIKCKCQDETCTATIVSKRLLRAYEWFRLWVNVPLIVNSGYRCSKHNYESGGSLLSRHMTGEAIDISLDTLDHLSNEEIERIARMAGFTFILFYENFVHLDVRNS